MNNAQSDTLTVLNTIPAANGNPRMASKTLTRSGDGDWLKSKSYGLGLNFRQSEHRISDIYALYETLTRVSSDPTAFIIRGHLNANANANANELVYRRGSNRADGTGYFDEIPRHWVMHDFDKVSVGIKDDLFRDPEDAVEEAIYRHLPPQYHDVTCVWQLSSSAGTTDTDEVLSAHIWYWVGEPTNQIALRNFHALHAPNVDKAVFGTVQPHYTSGPIFSPPNRDPLLRRIGLMRREYDSVFLPTVKPDEIRQILRSGSGTGLVGNTRGFEAKLCLLGDGPGLGGFNDIIPAAIAASVFKKQLYEIDANEIKAIIRDRIDGAPVNENRAPQDLDRYKSDQYLDDCIRTGVEKFALPPIQPLYPEPLATPVEARQILTSSLNDAIQSQLERIAA